MNTRPLSLFGVASLFCFLTLILFTIPVDALTASATAVRAGQAYTITYEEHTFLQEKVGHGPRRWQLVSGVTSSSKTFTGKAPGTYHYRSSRVCSKFRRRGCPTGQTISVTVYAGKPPTQDTLASQKNYQFEMRVGDINGDGHKDLSIRRLTGNINNGVISQTILRQTSDHSFKLLRPTSKRLAAVKSWSKVSLELVLDDFNLDGYVDLFVKDLGSVIGGVNDQLVFSSGASHNGAVNRVTGIDNTVKNVFSNVADWVVDKDYFTKHIKIINRVETKWGFGCNLSWWDGRYRCSFYPVYIPIREYRYDADKISWDGLRLANALNFCITKGELNAGSSEAQRIAEVLERVLGTEVFGGILVTGGAIPMPHEADDIHLANARFLRLLARIFKLVEAISPANEGPSAFYINHYTNEDGHKGIAVQGYVKASEDGYAYFTKDIYASSAKAKSKLAMANRPIGVFIFNEDEFSNPYKPPRKVQPANQELGGGTEIRYIGNTYYHSHRWIPIK